MRIYLLFLALLGWRHRGRYGAIAGLLGASRRLGKDSGRVEISPLGAAG